MVAHVDARPITLKTRSFTLRPVAMPTITQIAVALKRAPSLNVIIEGHTDGSGSDVYNLDLSEKRAQAVANALINFHGIERSRLTPLGIGEAQPIAANDTDAGRQENRRVEFRNRAG